MGRNHFYDKPRGKSISKSCRVSKVKDWVEGGASEGLWADWSVKLVHTLGGTKKFSAQRLKREHRQISFRFKRPLYRGEGRGNISILGVLFNIILEFTFSTVRNRKT